MGGEINFPLRELCGVSPDSDKAKLDIRSSVAICWEENRIVSR